MHRWQRYGPLLAFAALAMVLVLHPEPAAAQCAMCRTAFDSPEGRKLIAAFRSGVVFLLAVPVVTLGTVAYLAIRGQQRLEALGEEGEDGS